MPRVQGKPFHVILLAATMIALLVTSSFSADIETLRKQAEAGNAEAQYNLYGMYNKGQDVPEDHAEAFKWLAKAVNQGLPRAQTVLGLIYYFAAQNTMKQAKDGDAIAHARGGFIQAVELFRKAAEQGEPGAQNMLGSMYRDGEDVPQDYAEAAKWFRKAAEQGESHAQGAIGEMYSKGQGVPQDYAEAVKWFRKAAEQGDARGQLLLGVAYATGEGVPQNPMQTYFWCSLAASRTSGKEFKAASGCRDLTITVLTPEQVMEAQRMTREWEKSHPRK